MLFKKQHGARLISILIRLAPTSYLTPRLFLAVKRLVNNVSMDKSLLEECLSALVFDLRLWFNAAMDVQRSVLEAMQEAIRLSTLPVSVVSSNLLLRYMRTLYSINKEDSPLPRTVDLTPAQVGP